MSKKTNQVLMMILASYYIYCVYVAALVVHQRGYFPVSYVRFQILAPVDADYESNTTSLLFFGLLKDGCKMEATASQIFHDGIAHFDNKAQLKDIQANGYYFQTLRSFLYMPVRWIVQIGESNSTELSTVGASVWRRDYDGTILFYPQLPYVPAMGNRLYTVTELPGGVIEMGVDMRPPMQWSATYISMYSSNGVCLVLAFLAAVLRKEGFVSSVTIILFTMGGTIELLAALGYRSVNEEREYWCLLLLVPGDLMFALGVFLFESQLIKILFLYSALGFLAIAMQEYLYEFDDFDSVVRVLRSAYAAPTLMA